MDIGVSFGGGGSFFGDASNTLFGSGGSQETTTFENTSTDKSTDKSKQLNLSQTAIQQIITDALGDPNSGLASIFGAEQQAGVFNSSTTGQQSADLAAKLVAEITKLTSEQVIDEEERGATSGVKVSETEARTDSVFENILGGF